MLSTPTADLYMANDAARACVTYYSIQRSLLGRGREDHFQLLLPVQCWEFHTSLPRCTSCLLLLGQSLLHVLHRRLGCSLVFDQLA